MGTTFHVQSALCYVIAGAVSGTEVEEIGLVGRAEMVGLWP